MKGRKPKPTKLKILSGEKRPCRVNRNEPVPKRAKLRCPAWLHEYAKAEWARVYPELDRLRLTTVVDLNTLVGYCEAVAELHIARDLLKKEGHTVLGGSGGLKAHPAVMMQRTALKAVRDYAVLFGLDPSSRSRLSVPQQSEEVDELDRFLGG